MEPPKRAEDAPSRAATASTSARRLGASRDALQLIISNFDDLITTLRATPSTKTFNVHGFRAGPDRPLPEIACDPVAFAEDLAKALDGTLCAKLLSWFSICVMVCTTFENFKDVITHLSEWRARSVFVGMGRFCSIRFDAELDVSHVTPYSISGKWSIVDENSRSKALKVAGSGTIKQGDWPPSIVNVRKRMS